MLHSDFVRKVKDIVDGQAVQWCCCMDGYPEDNYYDAEFIMLGAEWETFVMHVSSNYDNKIQVLCNGIIRFYY